MSDFVNGYIEWRGRETLLKTQYGLLDKKSGNHLVPIKDPTEYMDGSDMDMVRSRPNQPPNQKNDDGSDYEMKPRPKLAFTKVDWITQADKVGGKIQVKFEGTIDLYGAAELELYATINGKYKLDMLAGSGDFDGIIEMDEWEDVNILRVFARGDAGSGETEGSAIEVRLNDQFDAQTGVIKVDTVLDMPYDPDVDYQLTKNRSRFDLSGTFTSSAPGDQISSIVVGIVLTGNNKEVTPTVVKTRDKNGIETGHWSASIPTTIIPVGTANVYVTGVMTRNGQEQITEVDVYFEKL